VIHTHRHRCVVSPSEDQAVHDDPRESRQDGLGWGDLISMGVTTAAVITVGVVVGLLVDHLLNTLPIFLFVGLLLGVAGAVSYLVSKFRMYLTKN